MSNASLIAVVFNEPTMQTTQGRMYVSDMIKLDALAPMAQIISSMPEGSVDMSEVGVIESREQVEMALREEGFTTTLFNINGDLNRLITFLTETKPRLIFNLCEGVRNQAIHEMHIAGIFELMGIPYTGAGAYALGTCLNKVRSKEIFAHHGIPTARFAMAESAADVDARADGLHFPLIVKPSKEDASIGIENNSVVRDLPSLKAKVEHVVRSFNQPALIEEFIEGRELNVAVMGYEDPVILPISEIDFSGLPEDYPKIVTYNAKWVEGTREYDGTIGTCPANLDPAVEQRVREVALRAYQVMEIRDYGRVDIRLTDDGTPYVLEVNPNPDLSDDAGFARSARTHGLTHAGMIAAIVKHALARTAKPAYAHPAV